MDGFAGQRNRFQIKMFLDPGQTSVPVEKFHGNIFFLLTDYVFSPIYGMQTSVYVFLLKLKFHGKIADDNIRRVRSASLPF